MMDEQTFNQVHSTLHATLARRGMWWIFVSKLIPTIKAFVPIVAGLAHTKTKITCAIFLVASIIWATMITSIGYFFGEHINFKSMTTVSFLIACIVVYFVYKTYTKKLRT